MILSFLLHSVTIAVSFKVYPGTNYTTSSTQIIEAVYNNFDVLREYYDVIDIKLGTLNPILDTPTLNYHTLLAQLSEFVHREL